jgi:hypothetical protein
MASINLFDQTLKIIARSHADLFLRLAFPDLPIELVGTPEKNEYVVRLGEQIVNRFTYPVLKLWDYINQ